MRLSRPVAVVASTVLFAAGAIITADAVSTTTTTAIKLCSNDLTRGVSVPRATGTCPRGTTAFSVAKASDVQALAARMDQAEAKASAQSAAIEDLEAALVPSTLGLTGTSASSGWRMSVRATNLLPGSRVKFYSHVNGALHQNSYDVVGSDGTYTLLDNSATCDADITDWYVTGTTRTGAYIESDLLHRGPGCAAQDPTLVLSGTPGGSGWLMTVHGTKLQPGALIKFFDHVNGNLHQNAYDTVAGDGTYTLLDNPSTCDAEVTDWYVTSTTLTGDPIQSNVLHRGPGCS